MANQRNLINAFDDCIERLTTGESLDDILKDYPDSAEYLRDLLMIGERISEVHNTDDETTSAQSRGRDKLQQVLKEKPKRVPRSKIRSYGPWGVAATFAVILGIGVLLAVLMPSLSITNSSSLQVGYVLTATQLLGEKTASAEHFVLQPTLAPYEENFDITATALSLPSPTLISSPVPQSIIITSVASMEQATVPPPMYETGDPDFPSLTATAQVEFFSEMTATALSDLFYQSTLGASSNSGVNDAIKTTSFPEPVSTNRPPLTMTASPVPSQTVVPQATQVADGSYVIPSQNNDAPTPLPVLIPLNAGEIDDNDEWDIYLLYRREFMARNIPFYDIDVTGRQIITVVDETGQPVLGATVRVFGNYGMLETRTYATGQTIFLPNADERTRNINEFLVIVEKDGVSQEFTLSRTQATTWNVTLPITVNRNQVQLDVLFLMDTTSSMADEIFQLQNNILHISDAVDGFADNISVQYGLLLYREHDNFEYVTRRHDFTGDVTEFQTYLNAVTANSGDNNPDWEESLNLGLDESLQLMSWRDENTIKLIFLVADAGPHINHPLEPITYDQSILDALARGIKIHPIASSGLEPRGEFIFRQIAQVTMGHFLFLTYDNGIVGTVGDSRPELNVELPESLDPIGGYTVDRLADVVLRLIQDEILTYRGIIQP